MLRLSYTQFMRELQAELRDKVGLPFKIQVDIKISIPKNADMQEKLENYTKTILEPILNSVPSTVGMQVRDEKQ